MFATFKRLFKTPDRPPVTDAEMFAIGDIHGRCDLLVKLMAQIDRAATTDRPELIFLGDYIDRGPDSASVIDHLLTGERFAAYDTVFLKGNHEATLLEFLTNPGVGPSWMQYGGGETLASYGVAPPLMKTDPQAWAEASQALSKAIPPDHLAFLNGLRPAVERGPYFFVHAGVDPAEPLSEQSEDDLLWIREAFLSDTRRLERIIVHGHTPEPEPHRDDRRIGLDTGAYQTGRLTAARIQRDDVSFIST